jgi:hypothetical protein
MSGSPHDSHEDAFISAMIESAEMDETRDYLMRGRTHAKLSDDVLRDTWVRAFRRWFLSRGLAEARDANDLAAELRLRNVMPPYERIRAESDAMAKEVRAGGAHNSDIKDKIDKFRADLRRRKN